MSMWAWASSVVMRRVAARRNRNSPQPDQKAQGQAVGKERKKGNREMKLYRTYRILGVAKLVNIDGNSTV